MSQDGAGCCFVKEEKAFPKAVRIVYGRGAAGKDADLLAIWLHPEIERYASEQNP
jgi:hypothetical protein